MNGVSVKYLVFKDPILVSLIEYFNPVSKLGAFLNRVLRETL